MNTGDDRTPPGAADGGEADAWLRAALRHAPDAELGAPAALSSAILREAVAATSGTTRRPAPPSVWQQLLAAWSWLAQPPVAAGFASVMLASVIGLMWWDKPLTDTLPARAPEAAVRPVAPVAEPKAAADAAAAAPHAVLIERVAAPADAAAAPAAPIAERRSLSPGTAAGSALSKARLAAPTPVPEPARREAAEALAAAAPSAAAVAAPAADSPPTSQSPPAPTAALAAAPTPPPFVTASARPSGAAPAPATTTPTADAAHKLGARSRDMGLSAPAAPLLTELRAAIRAEPLRWTWQRGAGAEQAMTAALRAWLDRLDDGSAATNTAPAPATELRLLRDGQLHTTLALGAASLRVTPADARRAPQQSALSAPTATELKAALEAATP